MKNADLSAGDQSSVSEPRDAASEYRRLLQTLGSRARRMGSRDPESAAQEALKRSLENQLSQSAVEYYFSDGLAPDALPPEWPLDQLMAWLHGVLHFVVLEEHSRVSSRREMGAWMRGADASFDPPDPAPDQLDTLIQRELQEIVLECLPSLESDYRRVLKMRARGLKYGDIAERLGVSENTVATWVSRGIRTLAQTVRRRMQPQRAGSWR